jgi:hypothetical protein
VFSFSIRLSHGCNLDMTPDEVSLILLVCNCSSSASILHCLLMAFHTRVATTVPQTSRGLLAVGPDMAKNLAVAALRVASLSSV